MDARIVQPITTVTLRSGLTLRYAQAGSGPPLVLMHTIRTQLEYFRELMPLLARKHTVYAVDLPGHGHSPIDRKAAFDEPYFRAAIVDFIETLGLNDVTLVGESIGGALALTVAAALPGRIKAVFALNPYDYETRYGDGIRRGNLIANLAIGSMAIPGFGALSAALENRPLLGLIMGGGYYDRKAVPGDLLAEFDRVGRRPGYRTLERRVLAGWHSWALARNLYAGVTAPVTLIYGASDWSRPDERARTQRLLGNPRVVTLPASGHFSALESPDPLARIILGA
jgi:pimeloyl-ACP methyl ester carboxylesterase